MIWQNVVLLVVGGAHAHAAWTREVARRRAGRSLRSALLPKRRAEPKIPDVTEVAG